MDAIPALFRTGAVFDLEDRYATLAVHTGLCDAVLFVVGGFGRTEDADVEADAAGASRADELGCALLCCGSVCEAAGGVPAAGIAAVEDSLKMAPGPKNHVPENQLEDGAGAVGSGGIVDGSAVAASFRLREGKLLLVEAALGVDRLVAFLWIARRSSSAASEGESEEKSSTSLDLRGGVASFLANMPASDWRSGVTTRVSL